VINLTHLLEEVKYFDLNQWHFTSSKLSQGFKIHGSCKGMLQVMLFFHSIKPLYSGTKIKEHPVECGRFLSPHSLIATHDSDNKAGKRTFYGILNEPNIK
jgi:hypothetical protein